MGTGENRGLDLSIVICTRGRARLLEQAIGSLLSQAFSSARYEILVVDDNATDDTAAATQALARQYPQIRYVHSEGRGLLRARFTGQNQARGSYIGFFDDDAKAGPEWLDRAARIVCERAPVCFGGPFYPFYVTKKPEWYRDEYGSASLGLVARDLQEGEVLCGGNVFFEAASLRECGGFDPDFCRPGERWTYGDEEVPQTRLRRRFPDRPFFYDPGLFILHLVRPERLNIIRAARECFAMGRAYVKVRGVDTRDPRLLPYARRAALHYLRFAWKALVISWFRDRRKHPYPQNYIYEAAFQDLRKAGVFIQSLRAIGEFRRQRRSGGN